MCGFVGFADAKHNREEAKKTIKAMADLIAHRGPDGEGFYVSDHVALGHRRLSIIDLEGGNQPMFNEDKSLAIVFNGEIYNFQDLRAELEKAGHVFSSHSDTEVLVHGYEEWGKDLPCRLRGMFAFAIWNEKDHSLFGARDIFGIKPFYYYQNDVGDLLVGSEIKSFLPHPCFKKELNEERLPEYLSIEYIPDEETMFKGVYKLPGAHCFTWKDG
ncbi:asparagine synthase (glutamine-hydrolyzing), partial [gut metagenome]